MLLWCCHALSAAQLACDAAEQTQAGCRVASLAAGMTFCRSGWDRDRHSDRLVELPPPGLHGDDGAEGGSVSEDRPHHVIWDRLGLKRNTNESEGGKRLRLNIYSAGKTMRNVQAFPEYLIKPDLGITNI